MNFNDYIEKAKRTCSETGNDAIIMSALGLAGETGEVVDLIKKWKYHGHDLDLNELQKELGDIMWYFAILTDATGLNFETILLKNIKKLKERYPDGFSSDASINRKE